MRKFCLGIAAVALAATGAYAQPGNSNGKGNDRDRDRPQQAQKADKAKDNRGNQGNAMRGKEAKETRGNARTVAERGNGKNAGNAGARSDAEYRGEARGNGNARAKNDRDRDRMRDDDRMRDRDSRYDDDDRRYGDRDSRYGDDGSVFDRWARQSRERGLIDGCPPGLAKKNNGCMPPGQAKRRNYDYDRSDWWGLPGLNDGRYRYYDGNLVRISDRGSISGYYPLLGGALSAGNVWPSYFDSQPLPRYYENFYGLGGQDSYRYADNAIYRVDPETQAITAIAALLTGNDINVGQPMPAGYDVYNVPYGYRDRYADGPDSLYRYSDGYVYQVDPTTQLVQSAIQLLL